MRIKVAKLSQDWEIADRSIITWMRERTLYLAWHREYWVLWSGEQDYYSQRSENV